MKLLATIGDYKESTFSKRQFCESFRKAIKLAGDEYTTEKNGDFLVMFSYVNVFQSRDKGMRRKYLNEFEGKKPIIFLDNWGFDFLINKERHKKVDTHCRITVNSIFWNEAKLLNNGLGEERWNNFIKQYNIEVKPWRKHGNHLLLLLNRVDGFTIHLKNPKETIYNDIKRILTISDRKLVIRGHPACGFLQRENSNLISTFGNRIEISNKASIYDDLKDCWACLVYTSSSSIISIIEGIPVFTLHESKGPPVYIVSEKDLSKIENPCLPSRQEFFNLYMNNLWSFEEINSGKVYPYYKDIIIELIKKH